MNLHNKRVLLTGASGGIGREIAQALEKKGTNLILVSRSDSKLNALRNSLQFPEKHKVITADLATEKGIENLRSQCLSLIHENNKIDVLINNAGCNQFSFLAQRSTSSIEQEIRLNLTVPILLSQAAVSWVSRPGIIVNIGSTFGSIGFPGYTTYCAAKSGLQRFSEALDRELNGTGIRSLYLAPRATNTGLNSSSVNQMNEQLGNKSDSPERVAKYVVDMLESETTARWIGWPEKLFARINQILPGVVSHSIYKQQETIHHFIKQIQGK